VTWTKLDDQFWSNPKVEEVGNEAAGAYARMLSYCGAHLTDGKITDGTARYIAKPKVIDRLAEFGFIVKNGRGWVIPDFLEFNPSKQKVIAKREADKKRKATE
jgi:hypothetical protein